MGGWVRRVDGIDETGHSSHKAKTGSSNNLDLYIHLGAITTLQIHMDMGLCLSVVHPYVCVCVCVCSLVHTDLLKRMLAFPFQRAAMTQDNTVGTATQQEASWTLCC